MDADQVVLHNALYLLHKWQGHAVYRMGADLDGTPPGIDCSAFAARAAGKRKYDGKVWWNSDRVYGDTGERWVEIPTPVPGCIGVYPGKTVSGKRVAGHVFVVLDPDACFTLEASGMAGCLTVLRRPQWFKRGATGNGKPIKWMRAVSPVLLAGDGGVCSRVMDVG